MKNVISLACIFSACPLHGMFFYMAICSPVDAYVDCYHGYYHHRCRYLPFHGVASPALCASSQALFAAILLLDPDKKCFIFTQQNR